jgi:hypothetical protein
MAKIIPVRTHEPPYHYTGLALDVTNKRWVEYPPPAETPTQSPQLMSANDPRDAWMYEQKRAGQTHPQIRTALAKEHPEWDSLDKDQAVGRAIDRYCERKGLPLLRRKRK